MCFYVNVLLCTVLRDLTGPANWGFCLHLEKYMALFTYVNAVSLPVKIQAQPLSYSQYTSLTFDSRMEL